MVNSTLPGISYIIAFLCPRLFEDGVTIKNLRLAQIRCFLLAAPCWSCRRLAAPCYLVHDTMLLEGRARHVRPWTTPAGIREGLWELVTATSSASGADIVYFCWSNNVIKCSGLRDSNFHVWSSWILDIYYTHLYADVLIERLYRCAASYRMANRVPIEFAWRNIRHLFAVMSLGSSSSPPKGRANKQSP